MRPIIRPAIVGSGWSRWSTLSVKAFWTPTTSENWTRSWRGGDAVSAAGRRVLRRGVQALARHRARSDSIVSVLKGGGL
jgi:hypothetical protein